MSVPPQSDGGAAPARHQELAELELLMDQVGQHLAEKGQLGLLSLTVLRRERARPQETWQDYEAVRREISLFLKEFSRRRLRRSDTVLRPAISGNTFVILLAPPRRTRDLTSSDTDRVQRRLRSDLERHLADCLPHRVVDGFAVCVGAALMRHEPVVDGRRVIYRCLEESFADALRQERTDIDGQEHQVRRILDGRMLEAAYQPLVDLVDRRTLGFEALTRMPQGPFATPDLLFRAARRAGALWDLERMCRTRALAQLPRLTGDQLLFLNIEGDSFRDPELGGWNFLQQLENAGLTRRQVVLELTEHSSIDDFKSFREVLERCREQGFRLAMDDVGSGYCGLQTIAEIEPDFLKVDMTLIRDLHLHPVKRELIATIRRFADNTGTTLIAEGVESGEELESLVDLGVRCAQGFLFARPGDPPDSPDWKLLDDLLY